MHANQDNPCTSLRGTAPRLLLVAIAALLGLITGLLAGHAADTGQRLPAFGSLTEFEQALAVASGGGEVEPFWARVLAYGRMPLVFGRTAIFLYRGPAESVEWRGDFSSWQESWDAYGEQVGSTEVWRRTVQLLPGSRLDYKIVVDGHNWMLDPLNPHQQIGGFGANSEARMPDWQPSEFAERREGTAPGDFGDDQVLQSRHLGYTVNYRVYTPPGLDEAATALPTLYVTDGSDYWRDEMGALVAILDNLYAARRIRPAIVVFVDPWDREAGINRRNKELVPAPDGSCGFCRFLVEELVPQIDRTYPTDRSAPGRAILGTSLGGLHATFMGLTYPDQFGSIGIQSASFWSARWILDKVLSAASYPPRVFVDIGRYERSLLDDSRRLSGHLRELGVDLLYLEVPDGHSWGHWRATLDDALLFFYGD